MGATSFVSFLGDCFKFSLNKPSAQVIFNCTDVFKIRANVKKHSSPINNIAAAYDVKVVYNTRFLVNPKANRDKLQDTFRLHVLRLTNKIIKQNK